MSITEDIALLVARTNALLSTFEGKEAVINTALAAAVAAVPLPNLSVNVDATNGNDNNPGTIALPFQTIDKALEAVSGRVIGRIYLLSDVTMTKYPTIYCSQLEIIGAMGTVAPLSAAVRKINIQPETSALVGGLRSIAGLLSWGAVLLDNINIVIPTIDPALSLKRIFSFRAGVSSLRLNNSTVSAASSGTTAFLAGVDTPNQLVFGVATTTIDASASGKLLQGVAAGANPNNVWAYRSNLTAA